ncbi:MAG: hypothetical protein AAB281_05605 [Actinomycetota bacterium]
MPLPEALVKTIQHFAPGFLPALARVKDPRNPKLILYPAQQELLVAVLGFMVHVGSRRNFKHLLNTPAFVENLQQVGRAFYPDTFFSETVPHGDTLAYLLGKVAPSEICGLRTLIIRALLRGRCLERFRLAGMYYLVAIDGTGNLTYAKKHCRHCLKKTVDGKVLYYYHPVLEAKLVFGNGMVLSIATEFIENERADISKQDCELKAFYRLEKRLKRDFPQLRICLLLDGLYAGEPVFKICRKNRWAYLITFKEGSMSAVFQEYEALKGLTPENQLVVKDKKRRQTFRWINDVETEHGRKVNVLECAEKSVKEDKRFVWLSSIGVSAANVKELGNGGGRLRWLIEEGFNIQKNGGYGLEHAFSQDNTAMKNFYVLMQIGHIFNQLMEKGSMLRERIRATMGSLKVFSRMMWAEWTQVVINPSRLRAALERRIQIRFDTS